MANNRPTAQEGLALLGTAQAAAAKGDAHGMVEALFASGFMDGLVNRLTTQWGKQLGQAEIRDVVAQAIDKAFDTIKSGQTITNIGGWLWKVATREITDRWAHDHKHRVNPSNIDSTYARPPPITDSERSEIDSHYDLCRGEALKIARRLLTEVGEGQVRDVMTLLFDAVEQGTPDLPPSQIGETLGISTDSARTLLSRGFNRLRRAARDQGIEWPESIAAHDLDDMEAFHNHTRKPEDSTDAE